MPPSTCNVRVIARFRPLNARERKEDNKDATFELKMVGEDSCEITTERGKAAYTYDRVYSHPCRQEDVYNFVAEPSIRDVLVGYNGTIFCYGQTGSGKTYTMFGPDSDEYDESTAGIIPRVSHAIFDSIDVDESDTQYAIKCSFLEIYKENIRDLLNPAQEKKSLTVHEHPTKGVWVGGLTEEFVGDAQDISDLISIGEQSRSVASTSMNERSSRSHSVFMVIIEQKTADGSSKSGKLNLVDLAGSEKVGKTGATGDTLEEAKKINQSLSALGNCIHALTEAKRGHIPYRDSKLTRILQESLGGNTKTTLVVCASPAQFNSEETVTTLKFGARAKTIQNRVKVNEKKSAEQLNRLVKTLQSELLMLRTYVQKLERQVEWMRGPNYEKGMEMPSELRATLTPRAMSSTTLFNRSVAKVMRSGAGGGRARSGSVSVRRASQAPDMAALVPLESFNPAALGQVEAELEKLRADTSLDALKAQLAEMGERVAARQERFSEVEDELRDVEAQIADTATLQSEKDKENAARLRAVEREVEGRSLEITDAENNLAYLEEQQAKVATSLAQTEETMLMLFATTERMTEQSTAFDRTLEAAKAELEATTMQSVMFEENSKAITDEAAEVKRKVRELRTGLLRMRTKLQKVEADAEKLHAKYMDLKSSLDIRRHHIHLMKGGKREYEETIADAKEILANESKSIKNIEACSVRWLSDLGDDRLRALARRTIIAQRLGQDTAPLLAELQTLDPAYTLEQLPSLTEEQLDAELTTAIDRLNEIMKEEFQLKSNDSQVVNKRATGIQAKMAAKNLAFEERLGRVHADKSELRRAMTNLEREIASATEDKELMKMQYTRRDDGSSLKILQAYEELEVLQQQRDELHDTLHRLNKTSHKGKFSLTALRKKEADLTKKAAEVRESAERTQTLLEKETRRMFSQAAAAASQTQRAKEQLRRIGEFSEQNTTLDASNASLDAELAVLSKETRTLSRRLDEESAQLAEAQTALETQNSLRMSQAKRSSRVFTPIKGQGSRALEEKVDFSKLRLKATNSRFLAASKEDHIRSQSPRGERLARMRAKQGAKKKGPIQGGKRGTLAEDPKERGRRR